MSECTEAPRQRSVCRLLSFKLIWSQQPLGSKPAHLHNITPCRVMYLDRATGQQHRAVVTAVDRTVDPPSFGVHIPALGTTRETVGSRLSRPDQAQVGGEGCAPAGCPGAAPLAPAVPRPELKLARN